MRLFQNNTPSRSPSERRGGSGCQSNNKISDDQIAKFWYAERARYLSRNMDDSKALKDILETVVFIKDNAASKVDLERFATKEDLAAVEQRMASKKDVHEIVGKAKSEIMTQIDGFVVLHKRIEQELVADRANYHRIAKQVQFIAKRLNLSLDGVV